MATSVSPDGTAASKKFVRLCALYGVAKNSAFYMFEEND